MASPRVAVVGSYGTGLTFDVERVPGRGETVAGARFRVDAGGKGSNQAVGAARLGAHVSLLSAVGDDAFGAQARALWAREGVDDAAVSTVAGASTMVGAIFVERDGENRIVVALGALEALAPAHVDGFEERIAASDLCLIGLEIPLAPALRALELARRHGVPTVLNPAPAPSGAPGGLLALADYLTPNRSEAATLTGRDGAADELAGSLCAAGATAVALTLGEEGALPVADGVARRVPAFAVDRVVDSTGAGDAFNAAFAVALAEGRAPLDACRRGCAAGAWMVRHPGVVPGLPTRVELDTYERSLR